MCRWILLVFFLSFSLKSPAQPVVTLKFDQLYIGENFDTINNYWTTVSNIDNLLIVQEGEYIMHRKATFSPYAILAKFPEKLSTYRLVTSLKLDKTTAEDGSIGIVFATQDDGSGGFILELNKKKQYRIRQITGKTYKFITSPEHDGWVYDDALKDIGLPNLVELRTAEGNYDLFINNVFIMNFSEPAYSSGAVGFIIGPASKGKADFIYIFTPAKEGVAVQEPSEEGQTPETDIIALAESIITLKTQINKLEEENNDLKSIIETIKSGERESETRMLQYEKDIRDLKARAKSSSASFDSLLKVNTELQKYKEMVKGNDNGDLVINLSKNLKNEKLANEALKVSNKALQDSINVLRLKLKEDKLKSESIDQ